MSSKSVDILSILTPRAFEADTKDPEISVASCADAETTLSTFALNKLLPSTATWPAAALVIVVSDAFPTSSVAN